MTKRVEVQCERCGREIVCKEEETGPSYKRERKPVYPEGWARVTFKGGGGKIAIDMCEECRNRVVRECAAHGGIEIAGVNDLDVHWIILHAIRDAETFIRNHPEENREFFAGIDWWAIALEKHRADHFSEMFDCEGVEFAFAGELYSAVAKAAAIECYGKLHNVHASYWSDEDDEDEPRDIPPIEELDPTRETEKETDGE